MYVIRRYGDEEQVMKQLEEDITKDVISLSRKRLGEIPEERDFKASARGIELN